MLTRKRVLDIQEDRGALYFIHHMIEEEQVIARFDPDSDAFGCGTRESQGFKRGLETVGLID